MTTSLATRGDSRALVQPDASLPAPAEFAQMQAMAEVIHASGMFPSHKNWQAILTCMIKGRELGIPATEAMQQIYMIQGKATCSANLMLALVQRDHGPRAMYVDLQRSDNTRATVVYRDPGTGTMVEYVYSWAMAEQADLAKKPMWKQYPNNMLQWRAVSNVARAIFPSSVAGMYTPEDLGASLRFDDEGFAVVDVPGEALPESRGEHAWPVTPRQIGYLKGLSDDAGWERDELVSFAGQRFGVTRLEELSRGQASEMIEHLKRAGGDADAVAGIRPESGESEPEARFDPAYAALYEQLEAAATQQELNALWKQAVDEGWFSDPTLYALYNRRMTEFKEQRRNGTS
jgi:hypothetical protein